MDIRRVSFGFVPAATLTVDWAVVKPGRILYEMDGVTPEVAREAFRLALKAALALNCDISLFTKWDRKQYYYPDLPKGYQISQFDLPFSHDGRLEIEVDEGIAEPRKIGIIRVHLYRSARMALGLGTKTHAASRITESNGSAFVHSGTLLEQLSVLKTRLAVATGNGELDRELNLLLRFALVIMDSWTVNAAITVKTVLQNPGKSQAQVGKKLKVRQNTVSTRLKRAHFEEIRLLLEHYRRKIKQLR
mgnify:CR=1 FL=1